MVPKNTGGQADKETDSMNTTATVTSSPSNQGEFFLTSRKMIEPTYQCSSSAHRKKIR